MMNAFPNVKGGMPMPQTSPGIGSAGTGVSTAAGGPTAGGPATMQAIHLIP